MQKLPIPMLFILLLASIYPAFASDPDFFSFGPEKGARLVICLNVSDTQSAIPDVFADIQKIFLNSPPSIPVSLVLLRPGMASRVLEIFKNGDSGAILMLGESTSSNTMVISGSGGKTAPKWLLQALTQELDAHVIPWSFETKNMDLYRLGWTPEYPDLSFFLAENIPSVYLKTNEISGEFIQSFTTRFSEGIPSINDRHYQVYRFNGKTLFLGEGILVLLIAIGLSLILFYLFLFGFSIGRNREQHLKDFLRVWWMPFLYLGVNFGALYIGQALTHAIFLFRFGNTDAWSLMPLVAGIAKLTAAWFVITVIVALNQLIRMPEASFIYGYIASIVCMFNIFIFSAFDFSLSITFLIAYGITFFLYHFRSPLVQGLGFILLLVPFFPHLQALVGADSRILEPLYTGSELWNLRIALFIMPFQLILSRILHSAGLIGRRNRFYLPLQIIPVFIFGALSIAFILFRPAWSEERPLSIQVRQYITETGNTIETSSPVRLDKLEVAPVLSKAQFPELDLSVFAFADIQAVSSSFLDRQLVNIEISPVPTIHRAEITVQTGGRIAVYDASHAFDLIGSGEKALFSFDSETVYPLRLTFSCDKESVPEISIKMWSYNNPYGLTVLNEKTRTEYLLEISRTLIITPPPVNKGNGP